MRLVGLLGGGCGGAVIPFGRDLACGIEYRSAMAEGASGAALVGVAGTDTAGDDREEGTDDDADADAITLCGLGGGGGGGPLEGSVGAALLGGGGRGAVASAGGFSGGFGADLRSVVAGVAVGVLDCASSLVLCALFNERSSLLPTDLAGTGGRSFVCGFSLTTGGLSATGGLGRDGSAGGMVLCSSIEARSCLSSWPELDGLGGGGGAGPLDVCRAGGSGGGYTEA